MKISITFKHVESHKSVEAEVDRHARKLQKLLKSYSADLVQLHGVFDENPRTKEHSFAVTLSLPGGTLHASAAAARIATSCKHAFAEVESQLKKHQSKLRKDHEWKRKRPYPRPSSRLVAESAS